MAKEFEQNENKTIWSILNIEETTDIKEIRHAYATMSKECHPESEPEKFQKLYQAYQEAVKWAKSNKNIIKNKENSDFADDELFSEYQIIEEQTEVNIEDEAVHDNYDFTGSVFDMISIAKEDIEDETVQNNYDFTGSVFDMTPVAKEGIDSFRRYFEGSDQKDWKNYVTTPEFLRAQYDETFAKHLAEYLKKQTLYLCEELPYNMIKELYFSYYPILCEQTDVFFDNGFNDLFEVIFKNKQIEKITELHRDASAKSEVIKYQVYYGLHCALKRNGDSQKVNEWEIYISDAARECFKEDGKISYRDKYLFKLLAFLIEEAPVLSDEIYKLLIEELKLFQAEGTSKSEEQKPLYQAISLKCGEIQKLQSMKLDEISDHKKLTEDITNWYYKSLTDDDRPELRNYFNTGLFYEYRLDSWFLDYWFMLFTLKYKNFSKVFLEEYIAFYDEVYKQTDSYVGREIYYTFTELLAECEEEKTYNEVSEDKKEWILKHFFEEGFTRVWSSTSKGAMKTIYKSIVMDHLAAITEQRNYEWDLLDDGHLMAEKQGENYVFSYDLINEKVTLSLVEYLQIVEEMLEIFLDRYFMIQSEKNKIYETVERAKEIVYGNHRN